MRTVKLVEELCYEDVHLKHIGDILALNVTQHVNEPLKLAVCRANPQEVHLMRREEQDNDNQCPFSARRNIT